MPINVLPISALSDNYVWMLTDEETSCVAVVDPGECAPVRAAIEAQGGRLDLILLTHHHADHIGAAETLRERYGAKMVGAAADAKRLPPLDRAVRAGDEVMLGSSKALVLETPGHTIGHIAYYFNEPPSLFCGDTMFSLGCGRLFEGTPEQMFKSLHAFDALPGETRVYCGHEYTTSNARFALAVDPDNTALKDRAEEVSNLRARGLPSLPSTLASERACNPFVRADTAEELGKLRREKDLA